MEDGRKWEQNKKIFAKIHRQLLRNNSIWNENEKQAKKIILYLLK